MLCSFVLYSKVIQLYIYNWAGPGPLLQGVTSNFKLLEYESHIHRLLTINGS